jgi:hypothetical protein
MKKQFLPNGIWVCVFVLLVFTACNRSNSSDNTPQPPPCNYSRVTTATDIFAFPPTTFRSDITVTFNPGGYLSTVQGRVIAPTVNATYVYGSNNQLNAITSSGATIRQPVYNAAGTLITRVNWSSGAYELLSYDASNRLVSVRAFNASGQPTSRRSYLYASNTNNVAADSVFTVNPSTGVSSIAIVYSYPSYDSRNGSLRALGTLPYLGNLDPTSIATNCTAASDNNPLVVSLGQSSSSVGPRGPDGLVTITAQLTYQYNANNYATSATGSLTSTLGFNVGMVSNTFTYSGCP